MYTLSYVCVTSGAAALVFSAFYITVWFYHRNLVVPFLFCFMRFYQFFFPPNHGILPCQVDIWNFRYIFLPLEWIGMNAMLVYVMAAEGIFAGFINGWYYDDPHNTLVRSHDLPFPSNNFCKWPPISTMV